MSDQYFSASVRIERAVMLINAHRYDLANEECMAALTIEPENADAYRLLGYVRYLKGERKKALPLVDKALSLAPLDHRSWMLKAYVHTALPVIWKHSALNKAKAAAEEALRLAPFDPDVFGLSAWLHNLSRKPTKALEDAEMGLVIDPFHENCLLQKVQALQGKQSWRKAKDAVDILLQVNPASAIAHNIGGTQALADGRFRQAAEHFRDAGSAAPFDKEFQTGYVSSKRAHFFGMGFAQRLSVRYVQLHLSWRVLLVVVVGTMLFLWGMVCYPKAALAIMCAAIGWLLLSILYKMAVDLWLAATDNLFRLCLPGKQRRLAYTIWSIIHFFITCGVGITGIFGLLDNSRGLWSLAPFVLTCVGYIPMSRIRSKAWRIAGFLTLAFLAFLSVAGLIFQTLAIVTTPFPPAFKEALAASFFVWLFGTTATHMLAIAAITKPPKNSK